MAGASITLYGEGAQRHATSDARGKFQIDELVPGEYAISAAARGFALLTDRTVQVGSSGQTSIVLVLSLAQASSVTVLGRVTVNGGATLSTASAPTAEINASQYAAQAVTHVSDTLASQLSTTIVPLFGGGLNAPAVVALRGPDPGETLVAVDGHQVNNGNTGDYDLSLLDPADLQSVQIVYGIAPSSLVGPDTLGGAINIRTLEPSETSHGLIRLSFSSYDTTGQTIQATGTDDRVGYALSYHRVTSGGEIDNQTIADDDGTQSVVGNGLDATSTLAKFRYAFDQGAGFIGFTFRDQAAYRDISAVLTSQDGTA
ncbi:MAG TPA: TonB-dependent receptor, partial [Candidatus Acidoferrales bacterium]|nr:TonB-dependent receptor [Candidatus Acidoferrales bacterium]